MELTITGPDERGLLRINGLVDNTNIVDDSSQVEWTIYLDADAAAVIADDLTTRHEGLRLYPVSGGLSQLDGADLEILWAGTDWGSQPSLVMLTSAPHRDDFRFVYYVNDLRPADAHQVARMLRAHSRDA